MVTILPMCAHRMEAEEFCTVMEFSTEDVDYETDTFCVPLRVKRLPYPLSAMLRNTFTGRRKMPALGLGTSRINKLFIARHCLEYTAKMSSQTLLQPAIGTRRSYAEIPPRSISLFPQVVNCTSGMCRKAAEMLISVEILSLCRPKHLLHCQSILDAKRTTGCSA